MTDQPTQDRAEMIARLQAEYDGIKAGLPDLLTAQHAAQMSVDTISRLLKGRNERGNELVKILQKLRSLEETASETDTE